MGAYWGRGGGGGIWEGWRLISCTISLLLCQQHPLLPSMSDMLKKNQLTYWPKNWYEWEKNLTPCCSLARNLSITCLRRASKYSIWISSKSSEGVWNISLSSEACEAAAAASLAICTLAAEELASFVIATANSSAAPMGILGFGPSCLTALARLRPIGRFGGSTSFSDSGTAEDKIEEGGAVAHTQSQTNECLKEETEIIRKDIRPPDSNSLWPLVQ